MPGPLISYENVDQPENAYIDLDMEGRQSQQLVTYTSLQLMS